MSISADDVNFLIRRYLQESGFQHTAFMFSSESMIDDDKFDVDLPAQAMITILKKGMLYMQLEKGINERAMTDDSPEHIILSIMESIRQKEPIQPARQQPKSKSNASQPAKPLSSAVTPVQIQKGSVISLRVHYSDVYCGAWSPNGQFLVTGANDAQAVLWEIQDNNYASHIALNHGNGNEKSGRSIIAVNWNNDGNVFATGCDDGSVKLWNINGNLLFSLNKHKELVYALQFSPDGKKLLTCAADNMVMVWDVNTGEHLNTFSHHDSKVYDVDWLDNRIFASCSADNKVCVCAIDQPRPVFTLSGHSAEVNKIAWDYSKKMIASCSDDTTVRVWRPFDRAAPIILQGHTHEVYTIKWSPNNSKILISGSFDTTLRIWDVQNHSCLHVISQHQKPIYSISFSPKGNYFVSGGSETMLYMWRTEDAALVASYQTNGGIFEAQWNPDGNNIALCLSDATVDLIPTSAVSTYSE